MNTFNEAAEILNVVFTNLDKLNPIDQLKAAAILMELAEKFKPFYNKIMEPRDLNRYGTNVDDFLNWLMKNDERGDETNG